MGDVCLRLLAAQNAHTLKDYYRFPRSSRRVECKQLNWVGRSLLRPTKAVASYRTPRRVQNRSFIPNWMTRGSPALSIRPKRAGVLCVLNGLLKFGWLNALKNSVRN